MLKAFGTCLSRRHAKSCADSRNFRQHWHDCARHDGYFKTHCRWWTAFAYYFFAHLTAILVAVCLFVGLSVGCFKCDCLAMAFATR